MTLETVYLLGNISILCYMIYSFYIQISKKQSSFIPIILTIFSWFLSSLVFHETIKNLSTLRSVATDDVVADVVGSSTIILSMNNYVLILTLILLAIYIITFITIKVTEGLKKWRK